MFEIYLDGRQHHRGVGVGQPGGDPLADRLGLPLVPGGVVGQGIQDEHLGNSNNVKKKVETFCAKSPVPTPCTR